MNLIKISNDKIINPESITFIQKRKTKDGFVVVVNCGGRDHVVTVPFEQLHNDIIQAGIGTHDQFFRA